VARDLTPGEIDGLRTAARLYRAKLARYRGGLRRA
jgi:hypothetical protein